MVIESSNVMRAIEDKIRTNVWWEVTNGMTITNKAVLLNSCWSLVHNNLDSLEFIPEDLDPYYFQWETRLTNNQGG